MLQRFNPLQIQLTTYTLDYLTDIYDKYLKVSQLRKMSLPETFKQAQAAILTRNDFFFFKLLKEVDFNYDLELLTIKDEWKKIVGYLMQNKEMIFNTDYIEIEGTQYPHDDYNIYFPFQNDLIEFVAVSFICKKVITVDHRVNKRYTEKELLNISEATHFTGYPINSFNFLGVLEKNVKKVEGGNRFKRKDLLNFMYRKESTSLEELI